MKTKHFKSALTNSVLSIEILKDFWSMFPDLYKYDDPKKAFNYANSENFKDNIFEFNPQLVPYHDYDADISKFEMTEKYFWVSVDKIINDKHKFSMNYDGCLSFVNGVKKKLVNPKEYCRLVIIHVMTNPVVTGKPKFVISKAVSSPMLYRKNKKFTIHIPVPDDIKNDFSSYKYHRSFAFFVNFFTETEEMENGETVIIEIVISCSGIYSLNTMLLEDSDVEINFPPHFED